jgi:predicted dehydrogenase
MTQHRVAFIGAGWMADRYVQAFLASGRAEVVGIYTPRISSAQRLVQKHGLETARLYASYQELVQDEKADIVVIVSPHRFHTEQGIAAADAGRHLVIEKPVAMNAGDLRRLVKAVRRTQVKTFVGFVWRWNGLYRLAKKLTMHGVVGKPFYVEASFHAYADENTNGWPWMATLADGGDTFLNVGIHSVDALRWFASTDPDSLEEVVEVQALFGNHRPGLEYPALGIAVVRFANGCLGKIHSDMGSRSPFDVPFAIYGDRGSIKYDQVWLPEYTGQTDWMTLPAVHPRQEDLASLYLQGVHHFMDCIDRDAQPDTDLEHAINTHEVCFAAIQAAREGRAVRLPSREEG